MVYSNRKTWYAIDNKSENDEVDDIGKTLQLKENFKYKTAYSEKQHVVDS